MPNSTNPTIKTSKYLNRVNDLIWTTSTTLFEQCPWPYLNHELIWTMSMNLFEPCQWPYFKPCPWTYLNHVHDLIWTVSMTLQYNIFPFSKPNWTKKIHNKNKVVFITFDLLFCRFVIIQYQKDFPPPIPSQPELKGLMVIHIKVIGTIYFSDSLME